MRITKPRDGEPIRLVATMQGTRYRVVLDAGTWPDGRRRQVTKTLGTLREARAYVAETRTELARGAFVAPAAVTFDRLAADWLASRVDVRPVTHQGYRDVLQAVQRRIGGRKVQSLTRADMVALVGWLEAQGGRGGRPLGHRTVQMTLTVLRAVLDSAIPELLLVNPARGVRQSRQPGGNVRTVEVWSPLQLTAFRAVADSDEWAAAWRLTLCGMRRSEVLGLSWAAVDLTAGVLEVVSARVALDRGETSLDDVKSRASRRSVPFEAMHPGTLTLLRQLRASQAASRLALGTFWTDSGLMVVDPLGRPVRPEAYSDRFAELCDLSGVPRLRLHNVRHSVALMLHRHGVAPADSAALLGHSVPVHMAHYVPRTALGAQVAGQALGQVLAGAL